MHANSAYSDQAIVSDKGQPVIYASTYRHGSLVYPNLLYQPCSGTPYAGNVKYPT